MVYAQPTRQHERQAGTVQQRDWGLLVVNCGGGTSFLKSPTGATQSNYGIILSNADFALGKPQEDKQAMNGCGDRLLQLR
jgi:hypothetical protein